MKNLRFICIVFPILLLSCSTSGSLQKGDEAFNNLRYNEAIKHYSKYLEDNKNSEAMERLGDAFQENEQFKDAAYWYNQSAQTSLPSSELKYKLASSLLATGNITSAEKWIDSYLLDMPSDINGLALRESIDRQDDLLKSAKAYNIQSSPINTDFSEYAPVFYNNDIVFVSDREGKTDPWTGRSFHELYIAKGDLSSVKRLDGNIGGNYHNGAASFTSDEKTMYFTKSFNKKKKGNDDVVRLAIMIGQLENGKWNEKEEFAYNSKDYNTMHPSLSKDGKMIVFVSDKEGVGKRDLFYSIRQGSEWGNPLNLYAPVNSPGNESFPYLADDGTLYFASDGHPGLGGYDLYKTRFEDGNWIAPVHLGGELNSTKDDISLISQDGLASGYFASNRDSDQGTDDIFYFKRLKEAIPLNGLVVDKYTQIPLPNVEVTIVNELTGGKQLIVTNNKGRFSGIADPESAYAISGMLNNISTTKEKVSTIGGEPDEPLFVTLTHNDPRFTLNGKTIERKSKDAVSGVKVILYNMLSNEETNTHSDSIGDFHFQLEQNTDYQIMGEKDDYFTSVQEATTKGLDRTTTLYVKLYLTIEEIIIGKPIKLDGGEIGEFTFNNILYNFDDWSIRPDAELELDKLVKILNQNPGISIELGSHTDSRGNQSYNDILSQKRAESAVTYIINAGVSQNRLIAKGYGESMVLNGCVDGVKCTEEEHQQNRRTEITVLKIE